MEIGSEFWTIESSGKESRFFLSGRTALDFILRDILAENNINTAHIPSFCCHSMIEPFVKNNIPICFYDVQYKNECLSASIPQINKNDIFFYIKFFGYENQNMGDMQKIKDTGCITIEDLTHSWLTYDKNPSIANYSFTSFRKWSGFTGIATAIKTNGSFVIPQKKQLHEKYERLRKEAQQEKQIYIHSAIGNKQDFLDKFSDAETLLENDYLDYFPTIESIESLIGLDKNYIKEKRQKNAEVLLNSVSDIKSITPMFPKVGSHDVPLCVPVLISNSLRDALRKYLISQQIYCPVHWPLSSFHNNISDASKEIYSSQLSLICDQRYTAEDMSRIAQNINCFFKNK